MNARGRLATVVAALALATPAGVVHAEDEPTAPAEPRPLALFCPAPCWVQLANYGGEWYATDWATQTRYVAGTASHQARFRVRLCNLTDRMDGQPRTVGRMRAAGRFYKDGTDLRRATLATTPVRVGIGSCAVTSWSAWVTLHPIVSPPVQVSNGGVAIQVPAGWH